MKYVSTMRRMFTIALCLVAGACGDPKVTTATFEPVYRAVKDIQGATQSNVSYNKLGELLQTFSTELGIAKDHELNATDKKLLALYQEAFEAYQFSQTLLSNTITQSSNADSVLVFEDTDNSKQQVERYKLKVLLPLDADGVGQFVARDSFLEVWKQADVILESANALYYGRPAPPE